MYSTLNNIISCILFDGLIKKHLHKISAYLLHVNRSITYNLKKIHIEAFEMNKRTVNGYFTIPYEIEFQVEQSRLQVTEAKTLLFST